MHVDAINPYLTNGLSHHYHLGEATFVLGAQLGVILNFYLIFRCNFSTQTKSPQMGRRVLRRHIWDYSVCLCPIKGTPGLNELRWQMLKTEFHVMLLIGTGQEVVIILMILTFISSGYEHDKTMKYDHITGIVNENGKIKYCYFKFIERPCRMCITMNNCQF